MNKPSTFELFQARFSLKRHNASLTQYAHVNFFFLSDQNSEWHDICPLWIDKTFAALLRLLLLLRAQIVAPVIGVFVSGEGGTPLLGLNRYMLLNRDGFQGLES